MDLRKTQRMDDHIVTFYRRVAHTEVRYKENHRSWYIFDGDIFLCTFLCTGCKHHHISCCKTHVGIYMGMDGRMACMLVYRGIGTGGCRLREIHTFRCSVCEHDLGDILRTFLGNDGHTLTEQSKVGCSTSKGLLNFDEHLKIERYLLFVSRK